MVKGRMKSVATADTAQAQKAYDNLKNKMRGVSTEAHRGGQSMTAMSRIIQNESGKIEKSIGNIGKVIAGAFAFREAAGFTRNIIQVRGEMQKLEIAFNTMLKSKEKTDALMAQMVQTAATTPFELMDVASGAKSLLAYGVAAEDVNETIIRLGNIASALTIPLGDMAYLFGTTMTQGKVLSKDMYQFMGRGIPIAEELAKQFGVAKDEILGMCSKGKVGFEDIKKALWSMTDEGGKFYNLMQEQSKTLAGKLSNLSDSFDMMLNDLGTRIEDTASKGIEAASWMLDHYEAIGKAIMGLVAAYGTYKAAMLTVYAVEKLSKLKQNIQLVMMYRKELGLMTAVQQAFGKTVAKTTAQQIALNTAMKANIFIAVASAVVGLVAALATFNKKQKEAIRSAGEAETQIEAEKKELEELMKVAKNEQSSKEAKSKAIQTINARYGDYLDNMIAETASVKDLSSAYDSLTASIEAKYLAQLKEQMVGEKQTAYNNEEADLWGFFRTGILADSGLSQKQQGAFTSEMQRYMSKFAKYQNPQEIYNKFLETYKKYGGDSMSSRTQGKLYSHIWDFKEAQGDLQVAEKAFDDFAAGYSGAMKKVGDAGKKTEEEQTTSVAEIVKEIKAYQAEIDKLEKKAKGKGLTKDEAKSLADTRKSLDEAEKKYKTYTGKEYGKAGTEEKAESEYLKKRQDFATKMQRAYEKAQNDLANATISAQKEGYSKEKAALEQENKEREQDIKYSYEDQLRQIEQLEREKYMKEHGGSDKGFVFDASKNELAIQLLKVTTEEYAAEAARFDAEMTALDEKYYKNRLKLREDYLKQYGTYAQKEKAIQDSYARQIKDARDRGEEDEAKLLEAERDSALYDLKKNYSGLYALIFADAQTLTKNQLTKAIQATQEEIQKATNSGDIERLSELYERLREQMMVQTSNSASSWGFGGIVKGFKDMKTAMTDYETALKNNDREGVNSALMNQENANVLLKESLTEVFDVFGELGSALESFGGTLGEIGSVFSGLASSADGIITAFTSKDKGALISTAISGVLDLVSLVGNSIAENKKAQEEWNQTVQQCAHEYTMLQLEALEYKEANMFGVENPYKKAIDSAKLYSESMGELYKMQSKLESGQVQTGTKKVVDAGNVAKGVGAGAAAGAALGSIIPGLGTLIGAGIGALLGGIVGACATKTVPIFESLTDTYGSILKEGTETFELNPEIIADYDKLDDATKKIVDNWDEIREKALQAEQEMRDNFSSLAGDIGSKLSDSLVNAFRNGDIYAAIDDFHGHMTTVIEDIVEQLIFAAVFQDMFDTLEEKMFDSFGEGGDQSIVDDLMWMEEEYAKRLKEYESAMTDAKETLSSQGYDAWSPDEEETERKGATKSGITASQDSVDYQNARLTTMQGHTYEINEGVKSLKAQNTALINNTASILREVQGIHEDTTSISSETAAMRADLSAVRAELSSINKNGVNIKR